MQEELNQREAECLYWASRDKSLVETARYLELSPETVRTHRKLLLRKLNCRTIVGALYMAYKQGIMPY